MAACTNQLKNPPVVELILDIDCDLPPGFDLVAAKPEMEAALRERYPKTQARYGDTYRIVKQGDAEAAVSETRKIEAFLFRDEREKGGQVVQLRESGYTFNRLAPYGGLDELLPEIQRTWTLFADLTKPRQMREIRLRYINRIDLPLDRGQVDLDEYFRMAPRLFDEQHFEIAGFLHQHQVVEKGSPRRATIVLTTRSAQKDALSIILDIGTAVPSKVEPGDWPAIHSALRDLRQLANRVFHGALTDKCLSMYRR